MLGAASQEYSVAYFGFDSEQVMQEFIDKYNNFVVEVEQRRKYSLEVSRAWFQPMPVFSKGDMPSNQTQVTESINTRSIESS